MHVMYDTLFISSGKVYNDSHVNLERLSNALTFNPMNLLSL